MALYYFDAKIITKSMGHSATAFGAYRAGLKLTCPHTGLTFNYAHKAPEVTYAAIMAPEIEGAPNWVNDPATLLPEADRVSKRKDAQIAREFVLALQIELTHDQNVSLMERFMREQLLARGMVTFGCLHYKPNQPHCHIMAFVRDWTAQGFGKVNRDWGDKGLVSELRAIWQTYVNDALREAGCEARVDHRSLKAQGIDRLPTLKVGRKTPWNAQQHDERLAYNAWIQADAELRAIQQRIAKIDAEIKGITTSIIDVTTTIGQALAERDTRQSQVSARDMQRSHVTDAFPQITAPISMPRIWLPGNFDDKSPTDTEKAPGPVQRRSTVNVADLLRKRRTRLQSNTQLTPPHVIVHDTADSYPKGTSC